MERALITSIFALVTAFTALAQSPQPLKPAVIVSRLYLTNQTTFLGTLAAPVPLFTPAHDGIYRASISIQASGTLDNCPCTAAGVVYAPNTQTTESAFQDPIVQPFIGVAGQSVGYYTYPEPAGGPVVPYDLIIVIEEL